MFSNRQIHALAEVLGYGTTLVQFSLLLRVREAGRNGISVGELAEQASLDHSTTTRFADVFGHFGRGDKPGLFLVERVDDPRDRRVRVLRLTQRGRDLLNEAEARSRPAHIYRVCATRNVKKDDGWEAVVQVPTFTVEASTIEGARKKAKEVLHDAHYWIEEV